MRSRFWLSKARAPAAIPSNSGWRDRYSFNEMEKAERDDEEVKEGLGLAGAIFVLSKPKMEDNEISKGNKGRRAHGSLVVEDSRKLIP